METRKGVVNAPTADVVYGSFLDAFNDAGKGTLKFQADKAMEDLVAAIRDFPQEGGSVTVKLEVRPMKPGNPDCVLLDGKVTVKIPQKPAETRIFFTNSRNQLVRNDPRQIDFDMKEKG